MVGSLGTPSSDAGFGTVRRGYDQAQVDGHLRRLDTEIRILAADRDAALGQAAQLRGELDDARAWGESLRLQVRKLASPPPGAQGMSDRVRNMLRLAEDEVAEMHNRAEFQVAERLREADRKAAAVLGAADAEAAQVTTRVKAQHAELAAEREAAELSIAQRRAEAEAELTRILTDAERERSRAWSISEAQRAEVEVDFAMTIDARRAAARSELEAQREQGRRHAAQTRADTDARAAQEIAEAEETARRIVAEAQRKVTELTELRGQVLEQLSATHSLLDRGIGELLAELVAGDAAQQGETFDGVYPKLGPRIGVSILPDDVEPAQDDRSAGDDGGAAGHESAGNAIEAGGNGSTGSDFGARGAAHVLASNGTSPGDLETTGLQTGPENRPRLRLRPWTAPAGHR